MATGGVALMLAGVLAAAASTTAGSFPFTTSSSSSVGGGGGVNIMGNWGPAWGLNNERRGTSAALGSGSAGGGGESGDSSAEEHSSGAGDGGKITTNPSLGLGQPMIRNTVVRTVAPTAPHLGQDEQPQAAQEEQHEQQQDGESMEKSDEDDAALKALKAAATRSGFLLPLTETLLEKNQWLKDAPRPRDLLLHNVLNNGADALPDVAPGVPFSAEDPEYDAEGWAHSPLEGRGYAGGRNKFKLCMDHADQWDIAFPEGWFQTMIDSAQRQLAPGFCVAEVVQDVGGSGCGDADVVLFNEGALIWNGAHKVEDGSYSLPPKHHDGVVYVYFAHEAPAGYGSELLDRRLMDQFDYLAYSNEDGSSLWWNFLPSARHLVQDYDAYVRPFSERQPVLGWLAIDCGASTRVSILGDISRHFPVWSIGTCRNNRTPDPDLPGRNMEHDDQRRRMQMILSRYLFYFSAENSDCPGYTTEKLWMALSRGSIPVYFGDEDIHRYLPCEECVLDVKKFDSVEALVKRMRQIASDEAEYNRITAWRFADPKTWPEKFRRGIAVASADVNRLTCSLLKEGRRRYKGSSAQVTKFGGYTTEWATMGTLGGGGGGPGPGPGDGVDIYAVNDDTHPAVKQAAKAAAEGRPLSPWEVNPLRARACMTRDTVVSPGKEGMLGVDEEGSVRVLGKLMKEYAGNPDDFSFTPPEDHYDKTCEDEQKMACYAFKG